MIFHITELGTYERCERKAVLTSRNGMHLEPLSTPLRFAAGSIWHRAHQLWITDPETPLSFHAGTAGLEAVQRVQQNYLSRVGVTAGDDELSSVYEAVDYIRVMCDNYVTRYRDPLPAEYRFLSAEQTIRIAIPGTDHHLQGKLDALIQHVPTNRVDVLERKSYNTRPNEDALLRNAQFMGYRYLVAQLNLSPLRPHVLYDGAWRRQAIPRGRTFEDLFLRLDLECNQHSLDEFASSLPRLLNEMEDLYTNLGLAEARPHVPWMGCTDCDLKKLCYSITRGEDYAQIIATDYTTRTDDLSEDQEAAA